MQLEGLGTVVMFAVAAILWFVYLVPVWFRRREYLATERNATRLQQTLRIMAETAEVPEAVRAEANARGAAHQERLLKEREKQRAAREKAALAAARRIEDARVAAADRARTRVRRGRLASTLGLLASVGVLATQGALSAIAGDLSTPAALVLGGGALVGVISFGTLRSLATRRIAAPAAVAADAPRAVRDPVAPAPRAVSPREWTPVPVPRPRYLGTPAPQPVMPSADAERLMREASEAARDALRAAHREAEVVDFPAAVTPAARSTAPAVAPASAPAPVPSRWAAMGRIDEVAAQAPDLDEVLRRRRAAS